MERTGVLFMQSQDFFGADSQIHASIMRHLSRERYDVHCAVPRQRGGRVVPSAEAVASVPGVRLRPTQFGPSFEAMTGRRATLDKLLWSGPLVASMIGLALYIRRNRIRIVHCTEKPRDAVLGSIVAKLAGAKCVVHVHVKAEPWLRTGVQRAMKRSSALIGVSEFVAGSIRDLLGPGHPPVHAVLNGLELGEWNDPTTDPAVVRDSFGVAPDAPLIVSASRLFRHKGQHLLLAALPAIRDRVPGLRVLIVGEDDPRSVPGEGRYSEQLQEMCAELDLYETVIFTGWRSDVRDLMAASDLYVMPSHEEPFGMVFIESMYLRRPVVALDNGGTREVVEHGASGLLAPPEDTAVLAEHVVRLLTDDDLRRRMGEHGRQRVADVLNAERMAGDVERVYASVISG